MPLSFLAGFHKTDATAGSAGRKYTKLCQSGPQIVETSAKHRPTFPAEVFDHPTEWG